MFGRQPTPLLLLLLLACFFRPPRTASAQEWPTYLQGYVQGHAERVTTTINGEKSSFDLTEPSVSGTLKGSFLSPQFLNYEATVGFVMSNLDGTDYSLDSKDINYGLLLSFFPGRRFYFDVYGLHFTDELQDNLLLFNRTKLDEVGGKFLFQEGDRMPQIGGRVLLQKREITTANDTFHEDSSEIDAYLDKRNPDWTTHLGYNRTHYKSVDYGFETTTHIVNLEASKYLKPNLEAEVRANLQRATTKNTSGQLFQFTALDLGDNFGPAGFVEPLSTTASEVDLGASLHYRSPRWDGDADYDFRRASVASFDSTQHSGALRAEYRPSARTSVLANYGVLRTSSSAATNRSQSLSVEWIRRASATLVYYVQGTAESSNSSGSFQQVTSSHGFRDFTVADLNVGVDYTRTLGPLTAYTRLLLGVGYATTTPGGSGSRSNVEARLGLTGRVPGGFNMTANLYFRDRNDGSNYSFDTRESSAQLLITRPLGRRFAMRALAYVSSIQQESLRFFGTAATIEQPFNLDIDQKQAEVGLSYFLPFNTFGSLMVGRTSTTTHTFEEDLTNEYNYFAGSLSIHPVQNLELLAYARIHRGFQLTDVQDDEDYIDLAAIYRLRSWEFLLGYRTNHYILGTTDLEQNRTYLTVRRNFNVRLR